MDNTKNTVNPLERIGKFTALVFIGGGFLMIWVWMMRGWGIVKTLSHPYIGLQFLLALLFFISARSRKLYMIQPIIFLIIAPINFLDSHDSFYGLGFFVMAILLLFKIGFFDRRRIVKIVSLGVYLYGWELFAAIRSGRYKELSLTPIFFVTAFLVYLYLLYKDKIIVYLKEPKPTLDLRARGLSEGEMAYILDLDRGKTPKEIASDHAVSDSTVRNTLARAYRKLNVKDKAELTSLLARHEIKAD